MNIKVSHVKTIKSYVKTLRSFALGDTRYYALEGTDYTGFHNARRRLVEGGSADFSFESVETPDRTLFKVVRTK